MTTIQVIVDAMSRQGASTVGISLASVDGTDLPPFEAGAHVDVHLPNGLIRQYSLAGSPRTTRRYQLGVKKEPHSRGGSLYAHEQMRVGQQLTISTPRNLFQIQKDASHHILIAGGIGITPLLAMAEELDAAGRSFELHYYVKRPDDAAFSERLFAGFTHGQCTIQASSLHGSPRNTYPPNLDSPHTDGAIYICGPQGMADHFVQLAEHKGWNTQQISTEAFGASSHSSQATGSNHQSKTFTVTLARRGITVTVPDNQSIAQALVAAGVSIPLSCEMGICGACLTPVIAGVPEHLDTVQSEQEKAALLPKIALCCSRSKSANLSLDL